MSDLSESVVLELANALDLELRWIPSGEFRMGSANGPADEQPVHRVVIESPFYLGKYPITQSQYRALVEKTGADLDPAPSHFTGKFDHPVEQVSWDDCQVLLAAMNRCSALAETLPRGYQYCLPSEAHWEYACRAGSETEYSSGDGVGALDKVAWYKQDLDTGTRSVLEGVANAFGVYDMHGNVEEWCSDVWDAHAYAKRVDGWQGQGWTEVDAGKDGSAVRVFRGGSFVIPAFNCRSAFRNWWRPDDRAWSQGLRLALLPVSGGHQPSQEAEVAGRPASERGTSRAAGRTDAGAGAINLSQETFNFET